MSLCMYVATLEVYFTNYAQYVVYVLTYKAIIIQEMWELGAIASPKLVRLSVGIHEIFTIEIIYIYKQHPLSLLTYTYVAYSRVCSYELSML